MKNRSESNMQLQLHRLDSSSTDAEVQSVLNLSKSIFDPDNLTPDQASLQLSIWKRNLEIPYQALFYVTMREESTSLLQDQEHLEEKQANPLGVFFAFPRTDPEIGHETLHLWIAGVHPSARGLGIFPFLMEQLIAHAKTCEFTCLSVCTYPKRFEKMYRILQSHGWEFVAWRDGGDKVLMKQSV